MNTVHSELCSIVFLSFVRESKERDSIQRITDALRARVFVIGGIGGMYILVCIAVAAIVASARVCVRLRLEIVRSDLVFFSVL